MAPQLYHRDVNQYAFRIRKRIQRQLPQQADPFSSEKRWNNRQFSMTFIEKECWDPETQKATGEFFNSI